MRIDVVDADNLGSELANFAARGIREVLLDDNLRADLIRRGREQAARFSWERTARQVLEIYTEAAAGA